MNLHNPEKNRENFVWIPQVNFPIIMKTFFSYWYEISFCVLNKRLAENITPAFKNKYTDEKIVEKIIIVRAIMKWLITIII
jgi:hypothetical protein